MPIRINSAREADQAWAETGDLALKIGLRLRHHLAGALPDDDWRRPTGKIGCLDPPGRTAGADKPAQRRQTQRQIQNCPVLSLHSAKHRHLPHWMAFQQIQNDPE
jgi:hypothetical protein